jgi:UDPglucose 6-dehydrogenase
MDSSARRVGVVGAGYVGLTSAACLAHLGHQVSCVDVDEPKVERLRRGEVTIAEPGLAELVAAGQRHGRLEFHTELSVLGGADTVLLCLPTPSAEHGGADLGVVESVLRGLGTVLAERCVLVTKSTVPVGTAGTAVALLARPDVAVVSNPEFLREGYAVRDFLHPDRIVVGTEDAVAGQRVAELYGGLDAPVLRVGTASAELAKYASNAFLALKVSYVNELAELCERLDADITEITATMGMDHRIGPAFLAPGPGWGGSCLPKDTRALVGTSASVEFDFELLRAALRANAAQPHRVVDKVRRACGGRLDGARIGLLGLAFKAGTGDLRDSPALAVARLLAAQGAVLTGYDPCVPAPGPTEVGAVRVVEDPYLVSERAEAIVVLTESPAFRDLDWRRLATLIAQPAVVDARNVLDPVVLAAAGLSHVGIGTPGGDDPQVAPRARREAA